MSDFIEFFSFQEPVLINVLLGSILVGISSSCVGCYTLLQKRALIGDAVAHAILPGVCLAFLVKGEKDFVSILIGSFLMGWFSLLVHDFIKSKTKLSEDTVTGIVLSFFFALGIVLLTIIQHLDDVGNKSGLDHFIFGSVIGISSSDILYFLGLNVIIISSLILFWKEFKLITFNEEYALSIGMPVKLLKLFLTALTVLAVVTGIQAVGVVLMAAMLVTPAATARFWTNKLFVMIIIAGSLGVVSSVFGAYFSYINASPTGPWIVFVLSFLAIISFLFAPEKGIVFKLIKNNRFKRKILKENLLKTFYKVGEFDQDFSREVSVLQLLETRQFLSSELDEGLIYLIKDKAINKTNSGTYTLTPSGIETGRRITKLHRLWEVYISQYLNLPQDHIHDDAEQMEHFITPELEEKLEKFLAYPKVDPHNTKIPYTNE